MRDGDQQVLRDLDFTRRAQPRSGRTGSGKMILSRLLFRLYDPRRGPSARRAACRN